MESKKTIALVAHNEKKSVMLAWVKRHLDELKKHKLIGTTNTSEILNSVLDLEVEAFGHGPNGGDILLAAQILEGKVDEVIFLIDAETPHGHEHDIQTLIRTCVINNVPMALNVATADFLVKLNKSEQQKC
ncbi:methylglyoxal synthase [Marinifilum flexuosum]|uniref:Methylglyoxal synthase n=1 Tax=Marinifilum flexuosum TaxID=1117708 RepID=A0A419X5P6_9BACT|nr:methylglyoxal synthase [Marinifilum flexuosum]RKE03037.1 methylglyoxal synthase [Marinifilum flexuosum]